MLTVAIGAIATLIGVVLGGGVRAWEAAQSRKADAQALLSSLVAEIEALTRLINHRRFMEDMIEHHKAAMIMIHEGRGDQPSNFMTISLRQHYFAVFDASVGKLGLLVPYEADRIVRFYTYAKAVIENYDPASPFQQGVTAFEVAAILESDMMLLNTIVVLGNHIASFRPVVAPAGVVDPFGPTQNLGQPALPAANVAEAAREEEGLLSSDR